jgi:hypothetical protein
MWQTSTSAVDDSKTLDVKFDGASNLVFSLNVLEAFHFSIFTFSSNPFPIFVV